jgi:hypothetical protein
VQGHRTKPGTTKPGTDNQTGDRLARSATVNCEGNIRSEYVHLCTLAISLLNFRSTSGDRRKIRRVDPEAATSRF